MGTIDSWNQILLQTKWVLQYYFANKWEQLIAHSQVVFSTFSAYFILEDVDWISREKFIRLL